MDFYVELGDLLARAAEAGVDQDDITSALELQLMAAKISALELQLMAAKEEQLAAIEGRIEERRQKCSQLERFVGR